jgi:predicted O-methyltransferase YrrM
MLGLKTSDGQTDGDGSMRRILLKRLLERAYRETTQRLPAEIAARVDLMRPSFRASWGGPLNGQEERRAVVRAIAGTIAVDRVLETGTYRGTSTEFFRSVFGVPVETVEADPRFHGYSRRRLEFDRLVTVALGDSRAFLSDAARSHADETVFIYLDAHWDRDLPLREELQIIHGGWSHAVVMIDDFAVPGDPGYHYDDYGDGKALVEDSLPPLPGWSLRYPVAASDMETGARRGSCVLLSPALAEVELRGLRTGALL